jgi:hypothetical protein
MKKNIFKKVLMTALVVVISMALNAQDPPPPPDSGAQGFQPVGGGAPVGNGLAFFLLLGAGYGTKKIYNIKNANKLTDNRR